MKNKEFKELKKENEKIRQELNYLIGIDNPKDRVWIKINKLIENELNQEELCNE